MHMIGKFYNLANGYKSYEIFEADEKYLFKFADTLIERFEFKNKGEPIVGLESIYWDFYRQSIKVTLGWDIWSGCFINAHCEEGSNFIEEIGNYINSILEN